MPSGEVEDCAVCPFCGVEALDHEQGDPAWEQCKFYCYNCKKSLTWNQWVLNMTEAKKEEVKKE